VRALVDGLLIAGGMALVGYFLQGFVTSSSSFTFDWQTQQYLIPYNVAVFWACVAVGIIWGFIQTIREMLRDVGRLQ
jgi:hypothetical protein